MWKSSQNSCDGALPLSWIGTTSVLCDGRKTFVTAGVHVSVPTLSEPTTIFGVNAELCVWNLHCQLWNKSRCGRSYIRCDCQPSRRQVFNWKCVKGQSILWHSCVIMHGGVVFFCSIWSSILSNVPISADGTRVLHLSGHYFVESTTGLVIIPPNRRYCWMSTTWRNV